MAFGAVNDHWGYADTDWRLMSSSKTPRSSNAQATDSFGDVACETIYDTGYSYETVYEVIKGQALDTVTIANQIDWPTTLKGGSVVGDTGAGRVITGCTIETSPTQRPRVTVTGEDIGAADSEGFSAYTWLTDPAIAANKQAQAMGFTPAGNSRVTSSTVTCTVELAATLDSQGHRVAADVHGGRVEVTGELVSCDTEAGATADINWTLTGPVASSEDNTDYGTSTVNVFKNITQDI